MQKDCIVIFFLGCCSFLFSSTPGTPKTSFGGNGTGFNRIFIEGAQSQIESVAIDSQGRIVGGGHVGGLGKTVVIRFTSGGLLDTSFGDSGTGYTTTNIGLSIDAITSIALDSNDKIIAAGYGGSPQHALVMRFNANGTLDTSFGTSNGYTLQDIAGSGLEAINAIQIDSNNRIVVCGRIGGTSSNKNKAFVMRFLSTGFLDTSFGNNGYTLFSLGEQVDDFWGMTLDSQERIITVGRSAQIHNWGVVVARFSKDGILDTSFGSSSGYTVVDTGAQQGVSSQILRGVIIDCMGQIVACGTGGPNKDALIIRFTSNGILDTTFGTTNGYTLVDLGGNNYDRIFSIVLDAANNIVGAGDGGPGFNRDVMVIRFSTNGLLDTSFGGGGTGYHLANLGGTDLWNDLVLTSQGDIVAVGTGYKDSAVGSYFN